MRIFAVLFVLLSQTLFSEIESVTLNWDPIACNQNCTQLLDKQFRQIPGVEKVSINQAAGVALLQYQPGAKFDYQPINTAIRMVGPNLERLSVKVKGEIRPTDDGVSLISTGDGTKFVLLSPVQPKQHEAVVEYSTASHQLSPNMEKQLIAAYKEKKMAVVSGPMLEPNRAPPNNLIIEQINFVEPEEKKPNQRGGSRNIRN